MADSDDDVPQLPADTLAVLQQFYNEQSDLQQKMEAMQKGEIAAEMPEEDWELSQFWYSDQTATMLARESLAVAGNHGRIACLSCPTLYQKLREIKPDTCSAVVLEYDKKFQMFGEDFIFYDYNEPLNLSSDLQNTFDLVIADPPFLSEECLTKTAQTVRFLSKDKIILCTGAVMEQVACKSLNLHVSKFRPQHNRNLGNDFKCYVNYDTVLLDQDTNAS